MRRRTGLSDNVLGAAAYCSVIPAIVFLLSEPYRRDTFLRFHSWQCIWLTVCSLVLQVIARVLPGAIAGIVIVVCSLLIFAAWLVALIQAFRGRRFKLPVIGDLAERQANAIA